MDDGLPRASEPRVGDGGGSRNLGEAPSFSFLFVTVSSSSSAVYVWLSLLGDWIGVWGFPGELVGVVGRIAAGGEPGEDWRRNGEFRTELKESGECLNGPLELICVKFQLVWCREPRNRLTVSIRHGEYPP